MLMLIKPKMKLQLPKFGKYNTSNFDTIFTKM